MTRLLQFLIPTHGLQTQTLNMNETEANSELQSFREQWRAEVRARQGAPNRSRQQQQHQQAAGPSTPNPRAGPAKQPRGKPPRPSQKPATQETEDDYVQSQSFDKPAETAQVTVPQDDGQPSQPEKGEPVTALEHYEKAVEKETAGSLGDSLRFYRKAFRVRHTTHLSTVRTGGLT